MSAAVCTFGGCSQRPMQGIPSCEFCKKPHCMTHLLPEVHGCRDACRNAARMDASREASETVEAKKLSDTKELREKMAKKRDELAQQRTKKKPQ